MSIKTLTRVWEESEQKGGELLTVLAIADDATDNGYAWPGIERITGKNRLSKRHTIRILQELEECGELFIYKRPGKSHRYIVMPGTTLDMFVDEAVEKLDMTEQEAVDAYWHTVNKGQQTGDNMARAAGDKMAPATGDKMATPETGVKMSPQEIPGENRRQNGTGDKIAPVTQLRHRGGDIATSPDPLRSINNNDNDRKPFSFSETRRSEFQKEAQLQMSKPTHQSYLATAEFERIDETAELVPVGGSAEIALVEPTAENGCENCTDTEIAPAQELCTTPAQTVAPDPSITVNNNGRNQEPFVFTKEHWRTFLEVAQSAMSKPMYQSALATAEFDVVDESGEIPIVAIWAKDQYTADWLNGQGSLSLLLRLIGGRPARLYARPKN
jgi:hypothetical protein